mgnify:CR=1 FL=1
MAQKPHRNLASDFNTAVGAVEPNALKPQLGKTKLTYLRTTVLPAPQTVLLIEDSDVDCATYERFLRRDDRHAYQIVAFETGEAALEWCQNHVADVILLDYQLPLMDGLDFLRALRQRHPEVPLPVIMMTGSGDTTIAVKALKFGAQDYIEKARITKESLPPLVRSVIRAVQLKRQVACQQAQQQLLLEIALQMRQSFEPQQALDAATQNSRQWLQCDRVLVYQFASDWSGAIVSEAVGTGWSSALGQQIQDTCFQQGAGLAYLEGHIWAMPDIAQARLTDCHRELLQRFAVKANLVVPILQTASIQTAESKPALWGLLIAHHCANTHDWEADETAFLQQVALHLSESLQQATLYQQAQTELVERKQAELALQTLNAELEQRVAGRTAELRKLTAVMENAVTGMSYLDPQGRYVYVNQAYANITGYPVAALVGGPWQQTVHPDDLSALLAVYQQMLETGRVETEARGMRQDGSVFYKQLVMIASYDEQHQFVGHYCFMKDISDRKRMEAALQASEARYRSLITAMAEGVVLQRSDGTITAFNVAAERILGLTAEQLMGKTSVALDYRTIHEDGTHFPGETHPAMLTLQTGQPQAQVVMGLCKGKGATTWIAINAQPLVHPGEPLPYAVVTSFADITALKQAELALKEQADQKLLMMTIAQHLRQSLDLDQVLQTTVTAIQKFLQTDRVIIYQFAPDWSGTIVAEAVTAGWRSVLGMQITDTYFVTHQDLSYQGGKAKATDDIYTAQLDPCHLAWLEQMQVRAKLVVPILQGEHLWGLLVAQQCGAPRHWEVSEMALQQSLATQIAIAIQQAEMHQQVQDLNVGLELKVQKRTAQLQQALEFEALLKRITDQVRDSLDEDQILQCVVQELTTALQADACDTAIYDAAQTSTTVKCEYAQDSYTAQATAFSLASSSDPHLYAALLQGESCHFCLLGQNVVRPEQPPKAILACPIVDDQRVLGDLWLFKPTEAVFTDREIWLVQQVAKQCAIALRQSRLYQAAQAQVQELARLNQLKDDFLSTVSHELRSPMASIRMATQMLEISLERLGILKTDSSGISRYFKILQAEGQREINLINDLLDLARLDAGTEPLNLSTISLQLYIPHLAESFFERTKQQQQQLSIHIPEALPLFTTDLPDLERILTELLHNACKYTPAGETITVSAQATEATLEIGVSNSGVEIPALECDRIFDKFYRIPHNDPWKHGGTGLGLALVKKMTARLGGQIHVTSGGGQTTFSLAFAPL